jgi:excisionase family DNA binding protein
MMTDEALTITVPEAGRRYFGMSRGGSYAAAERGEIPTVRIGRLLRVPVKAMDALLENPQQNPRPKPTASPMSALQSDAGAVTS